MAHRLACCFRRKNDEPVPELPVVVPEVEDPNDHIERGRNCLKDAYSKIDIPEESEHETIDHYKNLLAVERKNSQQERRQHEDLLNFLHKKLTQAEIEAFQNEVMAFHQLARTCTQTKDHATPGCKLLSIWDNNTITFSYLSHDNSFRFTFAGVISKLDFLVTTGNEFDIRQEILKQIQKFSN